MKKIYPIILFLFVFIAAKSQYHTETEYLVFEGYDRSYEIFVPDNYSTERNYPIVFILHGGGGTAKGLIRTTHARFNTLANRDSYIAVYPNGVGKSWNDGARDTIGVARKLNINDVGFFEEMINDLQQKYSVNSKQIFACGISNGGFMVQRLAFELSDKIKGIGVVAANLSVVQSTKTHPENPVPVIFINGTSDPLVPFEGGHVTVFRKKRGAILSVEESLETWKKINSCTEKTGVYEFPDMNENDGCTAIKTTWQNPTNSAIKTIAITVQNGGHTWPGTKQYLSKRLVGNTNYDFNGCDEIWDFFKSTIKNLMVESGTFYSTIIDPILAPMRKRVTEEIITGEKVIDIACGTGAQLFDITGIASNVTGIDLSESMINFANKTSKNKNIINSQFFVCNATNLSMFKANVFDTAIMTLALHQFPPYLHPSILSEMKRIANRIIIVDYAVPLPKNYAGIGSRVAEFLAGQEHNSNYKQYYKLGGLNEILPTNNLTIQKSVSFGKGAFQLVVCS